MKLSQDLRISILEEAHPRLYPLLYKKGMDFLLSLTIDEQAAIAKTALYKDADITINLLLANPVLINYVSPQLLRSCLQNSVWQKYPGLKDIVTKEEARLKIIDEIFEQSKSSSQSLKDIRHSVETMYKCYHKNKQLEPMIGFVADFMEHLREDSLNIKSGLTNEDQVKIIRALLYLIKDYHATQGNTYIGNLLRFFNSHSYFDKEIEKILKSGPHREDLLMLRTFLYKTDSETLNLLGKSIGWNREEMEKRTERALDANDISVGVKHTL